MYSGDGCVTRDTNRPPFALGVSPNTCFVCRSAQNEYGEVDFSSAFANVEVPKGVNCSVSLYWPSDTCLLKDRLYTGPPNKCTASIGREVSSGSFDCNEIPLPSEWPRADVTIYSSKNCGQGLALSKHTYNDIEANICTKADVSFLFLKDLIIQSGRAELVADTQIPIPPGTECKLFFSQTTDCRSTSGYTNGRGDPGVCVNPLGALGSPIKAFMWKCGYA
jgi:hypothetical protein